METKRTVMMILVTTVLALGLTVYGENLEQKEKVEVVKKNIMNNHKSFQIEITE